LTVADDTGGKPIFRKWSPYDREETLPVASPVRETDPAAVLVHPAPELAPEAQPSQGAEMSLESPQKPLGRQRFPIATRRVTDMPRLAVRRRPAGDGDPARGRATPGQEGDAGMVEAKPHPGRGRLTVQKCLPIGPRFGSIFAKVASSTGRNSTTLNFVPLSGGGTLIDCLLPVSCCENPAG
jgi:hypothetical protein